MMPFPIKSAAQTAAGALLVALSACQTGGEPVALPGASSDAAIASNPSLAGDATLPSTPEVRSDAGTVVTLDAATPFDASSQLDATVSPMPDATEPAVLDAMPPQDAADPRDVSSPPIDAQQDAAPRMPAFQKTRCIDPSKIKADTEQNFPCDGIDVWIVVPRQCFTQACGLVFNIHGGGMGDHATMDQATNMIALGSRADYIVVHPHKGTWSVADDRSTVFGFMQQVIQAFDVDRKRVHSTGYSQGGQLSWAIACEHSDVVASVAPTEEINRVTDCWKTSKLPARMPSVLFAYGKQDSIGGGYAAAQKLVAQFVAAHQLRGPETIAGSESAKYWRQRWSAADGNVLEFITQDYTSTGVLGVLAGHCLPMDTGDTFVSCSKPVDYNWGEEVIRFFRAHPMP